MTYLSEQRATAASWKRTTPTLPEAARADAGYVGKDGRQSTTAYDFCLPAEHSTLSLLPEVREPARALFAELGIPWHADVAGGPSNHLLSSQVQCVNALGQMVTDPQRLHAAFGAALGIGEVLEIEPGRHLTFEYIGPTDFFGESPGSPRVRGARCTSVDAAFLHRSTDGRVELVLLEWKYTESYRRRRPDPDKDAVRWGRYGAAWSDPAGPITQALPFADVLDEPFYQLVRQQLLAHELEKAAAHGAQRVRVAHVSPNGNDAYQQSLLPAHRELGSTVSEVWSALLRRPDRFVALDSSLLLDASITSPEYVSRYAPDAIHDRVSLLRVMGAVDEGHLEDLIFADDEFDGDVTVGDDGIDLTLGSMGWGLPYPFTAGFVHETARELQEQAEQAAEREDS